MVNRQHSSVRASAPVHARALARAVLLGAAALLALASCRGQVPVLDRLRPADSAHGRYADRLRESGLDQTALGRDWLAAAELALVTPVPVTLPLREAGFHAADEARATSYRVRLRRGQQLVVEVQRDGTPDGMLFVDVFELPEDTTAAPRRVASADSALEPVIVTARRDVDYVVRIQPELLRSGQWVLTLRSDASLAFPVQGRDTRAVGSVFGDSRDAGRREHHGIDIFAPRGTPVVAAAQGVVRSTQPNRLGGNVVWLWDSGVGQSLYYAHLDTVLVQAGQRVQPGDTLGTVGNSGNARGTPPHLHFGIYQRGRGPVDPYPFVYRPSTTLPPITAELARLGERVRTRSGTALHAQPRGDGALGRLASGTPVRILGASGSRYRVMLPDGSIGYLAAASAEAMDGALGRRQVTVASAIRERPNASSVAVDSVGAGSSLPVLGRYEGYALVRTESGREGWLSAGE